MRNALAAVLLFVASTAVAQPETFTITGVTPNAGTITGGDLVLIRVDRFPQNCDPAACQAIVRVLFGETPARRVSVEDNIIRAITPAHGRGAVDVSVVVGAPVVAPSAYTFLDLDDSGSLPAANFERVLVPVALVPQQIIPGAYGSQWQSELWVRNSGTEGVDFFNEHPYCMLLNPLGCRGMAFPGIKPGSQFQPALPDDGIHAGYIFHVQKGGADKVTFSLRIRDVSRSNENAGTELPVVHEREFRSGTIDILNVPFDSYSRAALRIYAIDGGGPTARVNVYDMSLPAGPGPVSSLDVPLTPGLADPNQNGFVARAGIAVIPDMRKVFTSPLLVSPPIPLPDGKYRIEVTGSAEWLKWAMVSVTNNSTQLVTAIGPQ